MIVGISGKIGAGKDAIAARLVERWGFRIVRFSDSLKEEVLERLPTTLAALHAMHTYHNLTGQHAADCRTAAGSPECLRRMVYEVKPRGVRELLQEYGTDVRRKDDPNYWTREWLRRVLGDAPQRQPRTENIVAPDVRFENEAQAVLGVGGELWRIERPGTAAGSHVSETVMDTWASWDRRIPNDGSLEALWAMVDMAMFQAEGEGQAA